MLRFYAIKKQFHISKTILILMTVGIANLVKKLAGIPLMMSCEICAIKLQRNMPPSEKMFRDQQRAANLKKLHNLKSFYTTRALMFLQFLRQQSKIPKTRLMELLKLCDSKMIVFVIRLSQKK